MAHGLECKKGGLVIQHFKTLPHSSCSPRPTTGRSADVEETEGMSTPTEEERGALLIRNLWKHQTDCMLDVQITNLDAPSNIHRKPEAVLLSQEREKK